MNKCMTRVRVRDAHGDDDKATTIKEKKEKENKFLLYVEMFTSQNLI